MAASDEYRSILAAPPEITSLILTEAMEAEAIDSVVTKHKYRYAKFAIDAGYTHKLVVPLTVVQPPGGSFMMVCQKLAYDMRGLKQSLAMVEVAKSENPQIARKTWTLALENNPHGAELTRISVPCPSNEVEHIVIDYTVGLNPSAYRPATWPTLNPPLRSGEILTLVMKLLINKGLRIAKKGPVVNVALQSIDIRLSVNVNTASFTQNPERCHPTGNGRWINLGEWERTGTNQTQFPMLNDATTRQMLHRLWFGRVKGHTKADLQSLYDLDELRRGIQTVTLSDKFGDSSNIEKWNFPNPAPMLPSGFAGDVAECHLTRKRPGGTVY